MYPIVLFSIFWIYNICIVISAQPDNNENTGVSRINGTIIESCDLLHQLQVAGVDGFFRSQWICMVEELSQRNTSVLKKIRSLETQSNQSEPCQQYTLGLFQIPNNWCTTDNREEFSGCTFNGCRLDCLKLLDDDIRDDIQCIKRIHKHNGFNSWSQTIVNSCARGAESHKWDHPECLNRRRRHVTTNISLWAAILIVLITSLVVFGCTYFFYKYRRNSHNVLSNEQIKDFKYGRIRGIPSVIYHRPKTIRLSQLQETVLNEPYNSDYEVSPSDFVIDHNYRLGSGAYGVVYKAMCRGNLVAVKTVNPHATRDYYQSLLGEIKILSHIGKHNCIVNLEGAYTKDLDRGAIYIFMEYCGFGSLEKFLRANRNKFVGLEEFSEKCDDELRFEEMDIDKGLPKNIGEIKCISIKHLLQYAHQIAKGMDFLSSKKVIHGDLAARNILLVDENTAKISDFGLSRKLYGYVQYIKKKEEPLPWRWMAIESLREMNFSTFSDVWMYGVLLFEIFSLGEVPYPGLSWSLEFVDKLENGFRILKPKHAPLNVYKDVMLRCWDNTPSERPSFLHLSNYFYQALNTITSSDYTEMVEKVERGSCQRINDEGEPIKEIIE